MTEELKQRIIKLVESGHQRRPEPFQLSSGEWSHDYIDGKRAIAWGDDLRTAAEGVLALAEDEGVSFDAVGGLTMGADPLACAVALLSRCQWFSVRKERKSHGRQKLVEGADIRAGTRVMLLDDVVTTGKSIFVALDAIQEAGAEVVLAVTLLDRGDVAAKEFEARGVRYKPLTTYEDLGIDPVGRGQVGAPPA